MKIEFYIGLGYRADSTPISDSERVEISDKIDFILTTEFGGYTRIESGGSWEGVKEAGAVYTVLTNNIIPIPKVESIAGNIRDAASQSCVAVAVTPTLVSFV